MPRTSCFAAVLTLVGCGLLRAQSVYVAVTLNDKPLPVNLGPIVVTAFRLEFSRAHVVTITTTLENPEFAHLPCAAIEEVLRQSHDSGNSAVITTDTAMAGCDSLRAPTVRTTVPYRLAGDVFTIQLNDAAWSGRLRADTIWLSPNPQMRFVMVTRRPATGSGGAPPSKRLEPT